MGHLLGLLFGGIIFGLIFVLGCMFVLGIREGLTGKKVKYADESIGDYLKNNFASIAFMVIMFALLGFFSLISMVLR